MDSAKHRCFDAAEEELLEAEAGSLAGEVARMRAARAALAAAASEAETALAQSRGGHGLQIQMSVDHQVCSKRNTFHRDIPAGCRARTSLEQSRGCARAAIAAARCTTR